MASLFKPFRKILLTPGPLNTSRKVKEAMLTDYGSRDPNFIDIIKQIKKKILRIANVSSSTHTVTKKSQYSHF